MILKLTKQIGKQNPQLPPGGGGGVRSRHRCHNNHHEHEDEGDDSGDLHHRQAPGATIISIENLVLIEKKKCMRKITALQGRLENVET